MILKYLCNLTVGLYFNEQCLTKKLENEINIKEYY